MNLPLKITVTSEHIAAGELHERLCPVALAITDALRGELDSAVTVPRVDVSFSLRGGCDKRYVLPRSARDFVLHFDHKDKPVKPFTFTLK